MSPEEDVGGLGFSYVAAATLENTAAVPQS